MSEPTTINLEAIAYDPEEPVVAMITVRCSRRIYQALKLQAKDATVAIGSHVSLNQLALSKLIAPAHRLPLIAGLRTLVAKAARIRRSAEEQRRRDAENS